MRALFQTNYGAGDGNRTHVISLEGWSSTIELHPQITLLFFLIYISWWRGEDSNLRRRSRQIYSLIPLATREPLHENRTLFGKETPVSTTKLQSKQIFLLRLSLGQHFVCLIITARENSA